MLGLTKTFALQSFLAYAIMMLLKHV